MSTQAFALSINAEGFFLRFDDQRQGIHLPLMMAKIA